MTWLRAGLRELPGFILPKTKKKKKKKSAPPSPRRRLKTKRKNKKTAQQWGRNGKRGGEKGGKEENGGYFQFQLHRWLKYSTAFQNLLTAAEVPQEALLVWNSTAGAQTCTCAPSHSGSWRHAHMQRWSRHTGNNCMSQINFVEDPWTLILKSEMRICHSLKAKIQLKSDSGSERGEAVYQNAPTPSSFICSVSISALTLC